MPKATDPKRKALAPIEYLTSLEWDGRTRVENLFGQYFNCGHDDYVRAVSRCFMIGAVRRKRSPGHKFDTMPVLLGPRGYNKASAVVTLFGSEWVSEARFHDIRRRNHVERSCNAWAWKLLDIDVFRDAGDLRTLRTFCSRTVDRLRASPRARVFSEFPRQYVLVGIGTAHPLYLDENRRFWPLPVRREIDLAPLARDRDQLWAEAAKLEAQGARDVLPKKFWKEAGHAEH